MFSLVLSSTTINEPTAAAKCGSMWLSSVPISNQIVSKVNQVDSPSSQEITTHQLEPLLPVPAEPLLPVQTNRIHVSSSKYAPLASSSQKSVQKCYLCKTDCIHLCSSCGVPTHGAVAGCSKMYEEGIFTCLTCVERKGSSIESPNPVASSQLTASKTVVEGQKKRSGACPRCGKTFAQNNNLKRHMERVHSEKM